MLVCIGFTIPLQTVPYQITETYYETDTRQESYTVKEPYIVEEVHERTEVLFDEVSLTVPGGVNVPFSINKPDARLAVNFSCSVIGGFHILSKSGHILYEQLGSHGAFEVSLPEGYYTARFKESLEWSKQVHIRLAMKWDEVEQVTRYKEVTKYRDIPIRVEKQRTITKYKKVSTWEWLFRD